MVALTSSTLVSLQITELGTTFTALGEDVVYPALAESVNELEALLGTTIELTTDQLKLRVLARWLAWRVAFGAAVGQYDLSSSGDSLKRSQMSDHIWRMFRLAEDAASVYPEVAAAIAGGGIAYVGSMETVGSPYRNLDVLDY